MITKSIIPESALVASKFEELMSRGAVSMNNKLEEMQAAHQAKIEKAFEIACKPLTLNINDHAHKVTGFGE